MKRLFQIITIVICVVLIPPCVLFYKIYSTSRVDGVEKADAIVVLGAAEYAGKPSPVFQARLDHAYELFQKSFAPLIITTGGTHPGEDFSEGEVGKKYLTKKGVPENKIIAETSSLTTKQNIMRATEILKDKKLEKIILVSDPFHMYRCVLITTDVGISAVPSPTLSSPISKNSWLELEYMGREVMLSLLHILFDV